jgi:hypothetical protein
MLRTAALAGKWDAVHWLVGHRWRGARLCFGQGASMLDIIEAESGDNPVATLIILHGLGADGNDFVPVAEELQLDAV